MTWAILAFTRNQKINMNQKALGEYFKFSDTSKQALQLLQRLGLSIVPVVDPGCQFSGPRVLSNIDSMFDEAKYRSWHWRKENEYAKFESLRRTFFDE